MKAPRFKLRGLSLTWIAVSAFALLLLIGWTFSQTWLPTVQAWLGAAPSTKHDSEVEEAQPEHDDDHAHEGHDEESSLEISAQTRKNIGLKVGDVTLESYDRSIAIPSIVVERPGQTTIHIAAPVTGVVTGVNAVPGESVEGGRPLFTIRLTHEGVVQMQTQFLQTLGQLDVENREIQRLEQIESGAVAPRVILERKYAKEKLEANLRAERESLQLHGINLQQIAAIERDRELLREVVVNAPVLHADSSLHNDAEEGHAPAQTAAMAVSQISDRSPDAVAVQRFVVTELNVRKGEIIEAGSAMATVADYSELYIEGRAFQQDADRLVDAVTQRRPVTALLEAQGENRETVEGLEFSHVANEVDTESRALHFYVRLPNEIVHETIRDNGRRFPTWRFKVGQRLQVRVPVETWQDVFALPVDAVAQEGPDTFVFVENGDHFHRRPVHVAYSDQLHAVIANDGSLFPGESVALNGAHQLQMAIKNKAGGAVDPHAGHNH